MANSAPQTAPMFNRYFSQAMTLMGEVGNLDTSDPDHPWFNLRVRTGVAGIVEDVCIVVGGSCYYQALTNLDAIDRDRYPNPDGYRGTPMEQARKYLPEGVLVLVEGIHQRHDGKERFEARVVHLLQQAPITYPPETIHGQEMSQGGSERRFYFEYTHWWKTQIELLADKWLQDLFDDTRSYKIDDFTAFYRTNLNIVGRPMEDNVQEMATLSRLIYGLSSTYLLTGKDRFYLAAKAGVEFQRDAFMGDSADSRYRFWTSAKYRSKYAPRYVLTAQNPDDLNTIPLYEQIYGLAGLAQYYRITNDPEVLSDIVKTVAMFQDFFRDKSAHKGWFSHIDCVTWSPKDQSLGNNRARKNWNSIGDHIPAYLVNLILALEPLPAGRDDLALFLQDCKGLLVDTTDLICTYFPRSDSAYVQERYFEDFSDDVTHGWQQNRGIVGHNLKISWNLTRAANYFLSVGDVTRATRCMEVADRIAKGMAEVGLDPLRGGCFDAVQRHPNNGMPVEFAWGNTKDFWQQEQGVLAYLILYGNSTQPSSVRDAYQRYAREMMAFWNLFFLDRDNQGVFFRTTENGQPVIKGGYGAKAGYSIAGYHSFELNYLAHIYLRSYFERPVLEHRKFTLYFRPDPASQLKSINVLPDFFRPGTMTLSTLTINGRRLDCKGRTDFQVALEPTEPNGQVIVEFQPAP